MSPELPTTITERVAPQQADALARASLEVPQNSAKKRDHVFTTALTPSTLPVSAGTPPYQEQKRPNLALHLRTPSSQASPMPPPQSQTTSPIRMHTSPTLCTLPYSLRRSPIPQSAMVAPVFTPTPSTTSTYNTVATICAAPTTPTSQEISQCPIWSHALIRTRAPSMEYVARTSEVIT